MACTFSLLVGGDCGPDPRSKNQSCQVIPLVSCNKNITCHKKLLKFSGCDTEIELILARSACFQNTSKHPGNDNMSPCTVNAWELVGEGQ